MINVYTIAYNEELQIKFLIDHYRLRFPNCHIVVYDNMSTDNTVSIAESNGCEVISYDTNNQIQDSKYLKIKNNCWKNALNDWVLVCDVDELLDINEMQLKEEEYKNITIIRSEGYNMVNMEDNLDIYGIKHGARTVYHDKSYLFNKKFISDINYEPGCHKCNPVGFVSYSENAYKLYHYNFINENLSVEKYQIYRNRLSPENLKNGWGNHYLHTDEQVRAEFKDVRNKAIKLL